MAVSRRKFLAIAGAGVVAAAVDIGGLLGSGFLDNATAATFTPASGRGLFGGPTTMDGTVVKGAPKNATLGYVELIDNPGEPHLLRTDLADFLYDRPSLALGAFVQITDLHIVDDQSPARVEFTDQLADGSNPLGYPTDS